MPSADYYTPEYVKNQSRADDINALSQILKLSLGTGLAAFGIKGIHEMRKRMTEPELSGGPIDPRLKDSLLEYPVPPGTLRKKRPAEAIQPEGEATQKAAADSLVEILYNAFPNLPNIASKMPSMPSLSTLGDNYEKRPWVFPAAAAGMSIAGLTGWKAAKGLGSYLKSKDQEEQLSHAQKEYEDALLAQYRRRKSASILDTITDSKNKALGAYLMYAAGVGIPTAVFTYNAHRTKNRKQLEEVLRQRAAMRAAESPAELYLVPEPYEPEDKPLAKPKTL